MESNWRSWAAYFRRKEAGCCDSMAHNGLWFPGRARYGNRRAALGFPPLPTGVGVRAGVKKGGTGAGSPLRPALDKPVGIP
ncbi:MAG: hypothetical protein RLZZ142_2638 [Verrucomicrobiota bacterium]|jgi:hypothetical protein